jgi:hypothetical protein
VREKRKPGLDLAFFFDGLVKSPSAALRGNFVVAAHPSVRLPPQFLRALHLEFFTKPSFR